MENPYSAAGTANIAEATATERQWEDLPMANRDSLNYHNTKMQKEQIIQKLREQGCRITRQRLMLLDIILKEECSCCKEIYYRASKTDPNIGTATVYRMMNTLEDIGAIRRQNMYKISCSTESHEETCAIELDDHTVQYLTAQKWNSVIRAGLKACGYIEEQKIKNVVVRACEQNA